jgi:hypothetical protein
LCADAELRIFRAAFDHVDVDKSGEMDAQGLFFIILYRAHGL